MWFNWRLSLPALAAALVAAHAAAEPPRLALPVDCPSAESCYVQNFVDADPGPAARDQTCGPLTYDGHNGVDIALHSHSAMREGVEVRAAAAGRVKALRDGMADRIMTDPDDPALNGRAAGNAVVLTHPEGWETQYSHLRRGSVAVEVGQEVAAGQRLGEIGLSGRTVFPHVEFSVRHQGRSIDPYSGLEVGSGCGEGARGLWTAEAASRLAYRASGHLDSGFLGQVPEAQTAWRGGYRGARVGQRDPALVFWVSGWGLRAGDQEDLRLIGPDSQVLAEHRQAADKTQARFFRYIGLKRRLESWPAGDYRAVFRLRRGDDTVLTVERRLRLSLR